MQNSIHRIGYFALAATLAACVADDELDAELLELDVPAAQDLDPSVSLDPLYTPTHPEQPFIGLDQLTTQGCGDGLQQTGNACFQTPRRIFTAPHPLRAIDAGQLDGGGLDFATVSGTGDRLYFAFGANDGSFGPIQTRVTGDAPAGVVIADFDADGRGDIATSDFGDDRVRVRWSSNAWNTSSSWSVGNGPTELRGRDVDQDGRADLIVLNAYSDTVTLRRSRPSGGFRPPSHSPDASGNVLQLRDCNGDGDLDLIYGHRSLPGDPPEPARIAVRRLVDEQAFLVETWTRLSGAGGTPLGLTMADFDENGITDAIAHTGGNRLFFLAGQLYCRFDPPAVDTVGNAQVGLRRMDDADFDGDGHRDFVAASSLGTYLMYGNGKGAFVSYMLPIPLWDLDTGDFNGDGATDIIGIGGEFDTEVLLILQNP